MPRSAPEHRPGDSGTEVADGIFEVPAPFWGYPLNLYFLQSGSAWAVIDTGISSTPAEFIEPFMRRHGGIAQLELAALTHGHLDHLGGNAPLREMARQLRFAVHEADLGWTENLDRHIGQLYRDAEPEAYVLDAEAERVLREGCGDPVAVDEILADDAVVTFGEGRALEVTHVGGHSPGHVLFRDRQTGAVFTGDALQDRGALNADTGLRDFPQYRTVRRYLAGLDSVRALDAPILCTAHLGTLRDDEIDAGIRASRDWTEGYTELLRGILATAGSLSLAEAVAAVAAAWPEYTVAQQIHVTTAEHLNELVRLGACRVSREAGAKRWIWTG